MKNGELNPVDFNSIKVQLKPRLTNPGWDDWQFQFHKGTIKTVSWKEFSKTPTHFNSIKVQLKRRKTKVNGAQLRFQFHKGTIKTGFFPQRISHVTHFNSIKVQLKLNCCLTRTSYSLISIP